MMVLIFLAFFPFAATDGVWRQLWTLMHSWKHLKKRWSPELWWAEHTEEVAEQEAADGQELRNLSGIEGESGRNWGLIWRIWGIKVEWLGGKAAGEEQQSFLNGFSSKWISVLPFDLSFIAFLQNRMARATSRWLQWSSMHRRLNGSVRLSGVTVHRPWQLPALARGFQVAVEGSCAFTRVPTRSRACQMHRGASSIDSL